MRSGLAELISIARQHSQKTLSTLAMSAGVSGAESILLKQNRLWGFRFSLGNFSACWQIESDEIQIFEGDRLIQRLAIGSQEIRRAA